MTNVKQFLRLDSEGNYIPYIPESIDATRSESKEFIKVAITGVLVVVMAAAAIFFGALLG
jgi:hypothetical protein